MRKLFTKKGSAEMISIILGIVVIGGLALAVTGTVSKQGRSSIETGVDQQEKQMTSNFNEASIQRNPSTPALDSSGTTGETNE